MLNKQIISLKLISRFLCFLGYHNWNHWATYILIRENGAAGEYSGKMWYRQCRECIAEDTKHLVYEWGYREETLSKEEVWFR